MSATPVVCAGGPRGWRAVSIEADAFDDTNSAMSTTDAVVVHEARCVAFMKPLLPSAIARGTGKTAKPISQALSSHTNCTRTSRPDCLHVDRGARGRVGRDLAPTTASDSIDPHLRITNHTVDDHRPQLAADERIHGSENSLVHPFNVRTTEMFAFSKNRRELLDFATCQAT